MLLNEKSKNALLSVNPIAKAINENRLRFFPNGKYSYIPSDAYVTKFQKKEQTELGKFKRVYQDVADKLANLETAFIVGHQQNKRVSHISGGKIKLV